MNPSSTSTITQRVKGIRKIPREPSIRKIPREPSASGKYLESQGYQENQGQSITSGKTVAIFCDFGKVETVLDLDSRSSNKTLATKVLVSGSHTGSHRSILVSDILHSTEENDPRLH